MVYCHRLCSISFPTGFIALNVRCVSAAVLGIIGAGGLGYEIYLSLQSLRYEQLWTLFYALILLNGIVDWGSGFLREKLGCTSRLDLNTHRFKVGFQRRKLAVCYSHR